MTVVITEVLEMRTHRGCGKSSQVGAYAQLYAYPLNERGDEDTVRDNNHALESCGSSQGMTANMARFARLNHSWPCGEDIKSMARAIDTALDRRKTSAEKGGAE